MKKTYSVERQIKTIQMENGFLLFEDILYYGKKIISRKTGITKNNLLSEKISIGEEINKVENKFCLFKKSLVETYKKIAFPLKEFYDEIHDSYINTQNVDFDNFNSNDYVILYYNSLNETVYDSNKE